MGASVSGPIGKGSNASTSGQPRMGQPSSQASPQYKNTIGGWDQAQIGGQTGQAGGKSGKGSGINTFQPGAFKAPQQATNLPVNQTQGMDFRGQDSFTPNPNAGLSFSQNMNNLANGPLGIAIGSIANAFGGTQAPAPVETRNFVDFAPSIDIGGFDGGGGYGSGSGPGGSGTGDGGYGPQ